MLGLQHLFIMYAGAVAVPLIVGGALKLPATTIGLLVSADLLVSGIATIIQSAGISKIFGVRLPVVAGATFPTTGYARLTGKASWPGDGGGEQSWSSCSRGHGRRHCR